MCLPTSVLRGRLKTDASAHLMESVLSVTVSGVCCTLCLLEMKPYVQTGRKRLSRPTQTPGGVDRRDPQTWILPMVRGCIKYGNLYDELKMFHQAALFSTDQSHDRTYWPTCIYILK